MGAHQVTQLEMWNDLTHIITYTQELSIAYRNSSETHNPNLTDLALVLKESCEHCHQSLERMLRSFLQPEGPNNGNTLVVQIPNYNINRGDKCRPPSTSSRNGHPTRREPPPPPPPPLPPNDFHRPSRRSLSIERRMCKAASSCFVVSPRSPKSPRSPRYHSPDNNVIFKMDSISHETQFLHTQNHTIEAQQLQYRPRSPRSPPHQYQTVFRPSHRSHSTFHMPRKHPQSEQRNHSPIELFNEPRSINKNFSKRSRSRSKNRDRSPSKRQIRSHCQVKSPTKNRSPSRYNKFTSIKRQRRSPVDEPIELSSSRSRSPPTPRRKRPRSPKSRSPGSPHRRRRRSYSPRPYVVNRREPRKSKPIKPEKRKAKPKPSAQGNANEEQQQDNQVHESSVIVLPPQPQVFNGPRAYFQPPQPRGPFQPNVMFYGPPQFAPRPPGPYFMPPRPRMMPYPPYRNFFPPN